MPAVSDLNAILKAVLAPAGLPADFASEDARFACAAMLDGGVSEFELGALIAGLTRHARVPAVLFGMRDAIGERTHPLHCEPITGQLQPVVIPNYACMRDGQLATPALPLIVLLLRRFGIPVLVHGAFETSGGLAVTALLRDFGILPCATRAQAQKVLDAGGVALLPITLVSSGLAALMALKARTGVETPAHLLAPMFMPVEGPALQVCQVGEHATDGCDTTLESDHDVLISTGPGDCVFGAAVQRPRLTLLRRGQRESLFDVETACRAHLPTGARALAEWTRHALDGKTALPAPVLNQLACCLYGAGYAHDINQAKAITAVETGGLAAA